MENSNGQNRYSSSQQIYKQLCYQERIDINMNIMYALKNKDLNINVEAIRSQDIQIFLELISLVNFRKIKLQGRLIPKNQKKHYALPKSNNSQNTLHPNQLKQILQKICQNISYSQETSYLQIINIDFNIECWKLINDSLEKNQSLRVLRINNTDLDYFKLNVIKQGLTNSQNITILDLSHNELNDSCMELVAQFLSAQTNHKRSFMWKNALKIYDTQLKIKSDNNSKDIGLKEINLSNNKFGDQAAKTLSHVISNECLIEGFDLSFNNIKIEGIQSLYQSLMTNKYILKMDLTKNVGNILSFQQLFNSKIKENINKLSKDYSFETIKTGNIKNEIYQQKLDLQYQNFLENQPFSIQPFNNHETDVFSSEAANIKQQQSSQFNSKNQVNNHKKAISQISDCENCQQNVQLWQNSEYQKFQLQQQIAQIKEIINHQIPDQKHLFNKIFYINDSDEYPSNQKIFKNQQPESKHSNRYTTRSSLHTTEQVNSLHHAQSNAHLKQQQNFNSVQIKKQKQNQQDQQYQEYQQLILKKRSLTQSNLHAKHTSKQSSQNILSSRENLSSQTNHQQQQSINQKLTLQQQGKTQQNIVKARSITKNI